MSLPVLDPTLRRLVSACSEEGGDDPIFALSAEAARRRAGGEDVVDSTLGTLLDEEGRLATIRAVGEAYGRIPWDRGAGYAPIAGARPFLAAVQADLFGSHPVAERAVGVATPGGTGALALAVALFLEPGQSVLTTSYHWSPYATIATQAGRGLETFAMFAADGRLDLAALAEALARSGRRQGRTLLFLNTPCHNPTGYSLDEADWRGLAEVLASAAADQALTVLVDMAYARYARSDPRAWLAHAEPLLGRSTWLVAWSASKAFTQYGARVGALFALEAEARERTRIASALAFACRGTWSNCNHLGMQVVGECLNDPELARRVTAEREELRLLLELRAERFSELARAAGLAHPRYSGGFFVTVACADAARAAARMRARGVFVVPLAGALRVALCATPLRAIPRLVEALAVGVASG
ncbi:MAG TPA: aminotransferase class I/II-fold pyridoxal phosphate-dependent enzyme [Planctomycetota bacterium]